MKDEVTATKTPSAQGMFKALGKTPRKRAKRVAGDFYSTRPEPTIALALAEAGRLQSFAGIWECAVGTGAMADVFTAMGYRTIGSDLFQRWNDDCTSVRWVENLYDRTTPPEPDFAVLSNPPFSEVSMKPPAGQKQIAPRFIKHLLDLGVPYIGMLLGAGWLHAGNRADFIREHPPARVYLIRWRLRWGDGGTSPSQSHNWVIWDEDHVGPTELLYLDRPPKELIKTITTLSEPRQSLLRPPSPVWQGPSEAKARQRTIYKGLGT